MLNPLLCQWIVSWVLHIFFPPSAGGACVSVCACVFAGELPAISINVSAAKWGERHSRPTGMLPLLWGSRSSGPDCFAQGQHDLSRVIYILVDCFLLTFFFRPKRHPGSLSMQSLGQNLTSIAHHLEDLVLLSCHHKKETLALQLSHSSVGDGRISVPFRL